MPIATIMDLTSYNPYKEAISMGLAKVGPYLIDKLTLEPKNVVSKIDRIRETLFGIRTQFLLFTQKNSLTKYTWVFLKSIPNSLVISRGFALSFYLMTRMHGIEFIKDDVLIFINCMKYLVFLLFLGANIKDDLDPPPKKRPFNEREEPTDGLIYSPSRRDSYFASLIKNPPTINGGRKYYGPVPITDLGGKQSINPSSPGGYKAI